MKLGIIADDFTGASDIALMLSEGGMKTVQYVGVPTSPAPEDIDAGVIALKSRTAPAGDAVSAALSACDWLLGQGCSQFVFKICSTFDSTDAGNIGPVTEALAEKLGETAVFVCPAFPDTGRTVYEGHLFVQGRLLNESGMQNHPLTPMTDPDIRRVMARQTSWPVAHIPLAKVRKGPAAINSALPVQDKAMIVVDAVSDEDLMTIGEAAAHRKLLTGAAGVALDLPRNFGFTPKIGSWQGVAGKAVALSGSCSAATRAQVEAFRVKAPAREIAADDILEHRVSVRELVDWTLAQSKTPLIYSSADPGVVARAQQKYGRETSAAQIETLFADLASALARSGVTRFVVAGGETSGAVVSGLDTHEMIIGPRIAAGVPALKAAGRPLALALKSGNFGGPDFFSEALSVLEGRA